MAKLDSEQKKTVGRVMHEWKHGELESSRGGKVRNRRQAVAIALNESGASNQQSPRQNRRQYARTKSKERHGETAQQQKEGRQSISQTGAPSRGGDAPTRALLYWEAARRNIQGRSSMNKAQLQRALRQQ